MMQGPQHDIMIRVDNPQLDRGSKAGGLQIGVEIARHGHWTAMNFANTRAVQLTGASLTVSLFIELPAHHAYPAFRLRRTDDNEGVMRVIDLVQPLPPGSSGRPATD